MSKKLEVLDCIDDIDADLIALPKHVTEYDDVLDDYLGDISVKLHIIKQAFVKAQEQEKENEILKEIIKSLFDRGCPLHQYVDKDWGLTIEVDDECSIMHLGEFKGVDLDKKLKEVLTDE